MSRSPVQLEVDGQRLWRSIEAMAGIGALPGGGCCRPSLSEADRRARNLFLDWCESAGCEVEIDRIGNLFARRPGLDRDAPRVATGSHLDTQPHGGRFDGVYGVLAGLEVIRSLDDAGIRTRADIEVTVWTNEEGVGFRPPLAGSAVHAGRFDLDAVLAAPTADGARVIDRLRDIGYLGDLEPGPRPWQCFVEAHIEQGPVLEAAGCPVGVVTGIQGIRWLEVELVGSDAHAGTTPMNRRRDALLGATALIQALHRELVDDDPDLRFTVGRMEIEPNSGATVAGRCRFNIDLRHPSLERLDALEHHLRRLLDREAARSRLSASMNRTIAVEPVAFPSALVDHIEAVTRKLGLPYRRLLSGAGHDAMNIAGLVDTGMIFVASRDGISHNEAEYSSPEHLAAGTRVLLNLLADRAGIEN